MRLNEGANDREAESAGPGSPVPRGVGLVQAVEHPRQILGRDAAPGIVDCNPNGCRHPTSDEPNETALRRVPDRIVCERGEDLRKSTGICVYNASRLYVRGQLDAVRPRVCLESVDRRCRHFGNLYQRAFQRQIATLGKADGAEVVHDPTQELRLLAELNARLAP